MPVSNVLQVSFCDFFCLFVFCFSCRFAFNMAGLACFILFCFALFLLLLSAHIIVDIIWALSCSVFFMRESFSLLLPGPKGTTNQGPLDIECLYVEYWDHPGSMNSVSKTKVIGLWLLSIKESFFFPSILYQSSRQINFLVLFPHVNVWYMGRQFPVTSPQYIYIFVCPWRQTLSIQKIPSRESELRGFFFSSVDSLASKNSLLS